MRKFSNPFFSNLLGCSVGIPDLTTTGASIRTVLNVTKTV